MSYKFYAVLLTIILPAISLLLLIFEKNNLGVLLLFLALASFLLSFNKNKIKQKKK